jgi:hypothetical protein
MEVLSQNFAGGTDYNYKAPQSGPLLFRPRFQNTSLGGCSYTNLLSTKVGMYEVYVVCNIWHVNSIFWLLLSRVLVTVDGVWIGEYIYWTLTSRNYK